MLLKLSWSPKKLPAPQGLLIHVSIFGKNKVGGAVRGQAPWTPPLDLPLDRTLSYTTSFKSFHGNNTQTEQ